MHCSIVSHQNLRYHALRSHYLGDIMRVLGYGWGCAVAMSWGAIHLLMGGRDGAFCTNLNFRSRSSYCSTAQCCGGSSLPDSETRPEQPRPVGTRSKPLGAACLAPTSTKPGRGILRASPKQVGESPDPACLWGLSCALTHAHMHECIQVRMHTHAWQQACNHAHICECSRPFMCAFSLFTR